MNDQYTGCAKFTEKKLQMVIFHVLFFREQLWNDSEGFLGRDEVFNDQTYSLHNYICSILFLTNTSFN